MYKRIDESPFLIKVLKKLSTTIAKQRGLPVVIGIGLIIIGFVVQLLNVAIGSPILEVVHILAHNIGLLSALIGFALSQPIGN
jgi:hypothetical protein